jgi:hypothetical protein
MSLTAAIKPHRMKRTEVCFPENAEDAQLRFRDVSGLLCVSIDGEVEDFWLNPSEEESLLEFLMARKIAREYERLGGLDRFQKRAR